MSTTYSSATADNYRPMYTTKPFVAQITVRGQIIKGDVRAFGLVAPVLTARGVAVLGHGDNQQ